MATHALCSGVLPGQDGPMWPRPFWLVTGRGRWQAGWDRWCRGSRPCPPLAGAGAATRGSGPVPPSRLPWAASVPAGPERGSREGCGRLSRSRAGCAPAPEGCGRSPVGSARLLDRGAGSAFGPGPAPFSPPWPGCGAWRVASARRIPRGAWSCPFRTGGTEGHRITEGTGHAPPQDRGRGGGMPGDGLRSQPASGTRVRAFPATPPPDSGKESG